MKLILLSDLHLTLDDPVGRLDDVGTTGTKKLSYVLDKAVKLKASAIIIAGDISDKPRSWHLLPSLASLLSPTIQKIPIFAIFGQHDMYMREGRVSTTLGVLASTGIIKLLGEKPTEIASDGEKVYLYGADFEDDVPEPNAKPAVLAIHKMLLMSKLWKDQEGAEYAPSFLNNHKGWDLILCGDAHQKFSYISPDGRIICNSGPLLRLEASEEMHKHKPGFFVYDTISGKLSWEGIPHKKAEEVLTRKHIEKEERNNAMLESFISSVQSTDAGSGITFQQIFTEFIKKNKVPKEVREILAEIIGEGDVWLQETLKTK